MGVALAREKTASERVQCELTRIAERVMRWMGTLGKGGKNGKNVKERGGGEGCDGSRSIGETRGGADGVGTLVTVRGRC